MVRLVIFTDRDNRPLRQASCGAPRVFSMTPGSGTAIVNRAQNDDSYPAAHADTGAGPHQHL